MSIHELKQSQDFLCLTTLTSLNFADDERLASVTTVGPKVFYVLDDEIVKLVESRIPVFVLAE